MKSPIVSPSHRRAVGVLLAPVVALVLALAGAGAAHAEDGYRYWNYSHLDGDTFTFAKTGPADFTPEDGGVEGWRFGTSTASQGLEPRADLSDVTFDAVCADATAEAGDKRVAVLVDYGTTDDADGAKAPSPRAECAVVPEAANGQQTLESVAEIRGDKGMICALDGYPASGCGTAVPDAEVSPDPSTVTFAVPEAGNTENTSAEDTSDDAGRDISWPLVAVIAAIVVLGGVAVPLYRRGRES